MSLYLPYERQLTNVELYSGRWIDWISYEENPVATGEEIDTEHKSTGSHSKYTAMQADAWGGVFAGPQRHPGIRERGIVARED
ncbi:hypothetical protein MHB85_22780 [Paenibacillus sp. FSL K6-4396]|uniref:hypothetical protein n=1 Tax=Paenibacillus sp. FSL K6-4396 TaxID=2921506 RepID=UPI0030F76824